jgi:hypothetical protein
MNRFIRVVLVPVAALTILVSSAVPASAAPLTFAIVIGPLSMNW